MWNKKEINNIKELYSVLQAEVKNANPLIEQMRCVIYYNDMIVHLYTAFDFLDDYQNIPLDNVIKFYLYQPFNKN